MQILFRLFSDYGRAMLEVRHAMGRVLEMLCMDMQQRLLHGWRQFLRSERLLQTVFDNFCQQRKMHGVFVG